jgi:hypothetical protein
MATQSLGTPEEIAGLRDAVALVIALRRGADLALIEALVGIIEVFGIDSAACRGVPFDELLRRVSLCLAAQPNALNQSA